MESTLCTAAEIIVGMFARPSRLERNYEAQERTQDSKDWGSYTTDSFGLQGNDEEDEEEQEGQEEL